MSDSVIASNQSLRVQRKTFQFNPTAGDITQTMFTATNNSYIEVHYAQVQGNSMAQLKVIDNITGVQLAILSQNTGGGGAGVAISSAQHALTPTIQSSGNGQSYSEVLVIPSGCRLEARAVNVSTVVNGMVAIGIEFINSP